jgi:SAM-dependent methyltransferase
MERKMHWEQVYREKQPNAVSWYQAHPDASLNLIDSVTITPGCPIIDVGGGASTLVDHLLARGFTDITVLDIAAPALAIARERLGPAAAALTWLVADVSRAQLPAARYGLWHDRAVFHFLTEPADQQAYLATLRQALKPGGYVLLATFAPDGPQSCSGLEVVRYSAEALAALLGAEFVPVHTGRDQHQTPAGGHQAFTFALFQRTQPAIAGQ